MNESEKVRESVGPVFQTGPATDAVLDAIRESNARVSTQDRGSYVRVLVPGRCTVTRRAIESHLGRAFRLPTDLEAIMTSFRGRLTISEDEATWESRDGDAR